MIDSGPLFLVVVVTLTAGGLAGFLGAVLVHRRRSAARTLRWERRFEALETEVGTARFERAAAIEEKRGLGADLEALRETLTLLRSELEAHREITAESNLDRDFAIRRAEAAVDELASCRISLEEAEAARDVLAAAVRELKPIAEQRALLAARLEEHARVQAELESDRTRLALLVETLERQLRQALGANRQDQDRLEAGRSLMAAQLRDRRRQLEEARVAMTRLEADLAAARSAWAGETTRATDAEAAIRAVELRHQETLARLAAEQGSLQAQAERVEPLRRQLADREELIRSIARERDDSAAALVRRERELQDELERLGGELAETTRRAGRIAELEARVAELEARIGVTARARDDHQAAERQLRAQVEWLAAEIRDRDHRFRVLLDDRRDAMTRAQDEIARLREEIGRLRASASTPEPGEATAEGPAGDGDPVDGPGVRIDSRHEGENGAGAVEDDLKRISGIGPAIERVLRSRGIVTFRQIAAWSDEDIDRHSRDLGAFRTRIRRDRWVEQARRAHEQLHGERL